MKHEIVLGVIFLIAGTPPALALQPCRPAPLARALYPRPARDAQMLAKTRAPQDAVIFLRVSSATPPKLRLARERGDVTVATRLIGPVAPNLYLLIPTSPLTASSRYVVTMLPATTSQKFLWERRHRSREMIPQVVVRFRVAGKGARGKPVALGKASLSFSPSAKPQRSRGRRGPLIRRAGRSAILQLTPGAVAPAVVVVTGRFIGAPHPIRWSASFSFRETLFIATNTLTCGYLPARPTAPRRGRYELSVTPWSPQGGAGSPVRLSGKIMSQKRSRP